MRSVMKWVFALFAVFTAFPAIAQEKQAIDAFAYLFPRPTGANGYEELVKAGALVERNEFAQATTKDANAPLSDIRKLLGESDIRMARTLFAAGMAKPATDPRTEMTPSVRLPEFPLFRAYARLHAKEIVLALAEGKNEDAIKALRTGLQFSRVIQQKSLLSGLVGLAIGAVVLKPFDGALAKFSAKDCDALLTVVREWLQEKSPVADIIGAEEKNTRNIIRLLKEKPERLLDYMREWGATDEGMLPFQSKGLDVATLLVQAERKLAAYFQAANDAIKAPAYERRSMDNFSSETLAGQLLNLFCPQLKRVPDLYDKFQNRVQSLGVRCALRRRFIEKKRFPDSLAELNLGGMTTDLFTGKPAEYRRDATLYTLKFLDPKLSD